jgi:hypothetical protein
MARTLGSSPWLSTAGLLGLTVLLSGSYCDWRGYHVPGSLQASSTDTTIGPVGAFASVYVNGTEFFDSYATITIDGITASESQLLVGQVATVGGGASSGTGTAISIAVTTKLLGPVAAIDFAGGTVTVLGQTVQITGDTSIGSEIFPNDIDGVLLGDVVAIDGYRTSTGLIASRFDLATAAPAYLVAGRVANLNSAIHTFTINGTTVDFSGASIGLPAGLANGNYVVASGTILLDVSTLSASLVSAQNEVPTGGNGTSGSVHGAVTRYGSAADFDVGGQTVATSSTTTYQSGVSSNVGPDAEVEVSGTYDSAGVLNAATVALLPTANVRVVGPIGAIDAAGQTLTVAGVTLGTTTETRWDDRSAMLLRTFGFTSLRIGDWVVVRGVPASGASATARLVERSTPPSPALVELQDIATAVAAPDLTLTGVTVATVSATFTDANGMPLTRTAFFGQAAGRLVRASGTMFGAGTLVASSVALRN